MDERFGDKASIVVQNLRSIICIPLLLGGNVVGVLYADNRFRKEVFQYENVPILTAFGTQAAIAITNAKLFGQVKENLEEAERVIRELRIEVDQGRVSSQVDEITGTDYFKVLAETANKLRARSMNRRGDGSKEEDEIEPQK
jgi:GAF domain-containing protein